MGWKKEYGEDWKSTNLSRSGGRKEGRREGKEGGREEGRKGRRFKPTFG